MKTNLRLVPKPRNVTNVTHSSRLVPLTEPLFRMVAAVQQPHPMAVTEAVLSSVLARDHAFAVVDGGELVCALGVFLVHFGRGHGWLLKTPLARPRQMAFAVHQARAHFDRWQAEDPAYRRIAMQVLASEPWRENFARRLGMTESFGPMRKWDAMGRDYWLYARTV